MTDRGFTSHLSPFDALDACSGQAFQLLLPAFSRGSTAGEGAFPGWFAGCSYSSEALSAGAGELFLARSRAILSALAVSQL